MSWRGDGGFLEARGEKEHMVLIGNENKVCVQPLCYNINQYVEETPIGFC